MSNGAGKAELHYTGILGVEDRYARAQPTNASMAFNLDFKDGIISRRLGRQQLLNTAFVRPARVLWYSSSTLTDATYTMTDGDNATVSITNPFAASGSLYIGLPHRFYGIKLYVSSAMSTVATMTVKTFNRSSASLGTWTAVTIADGTNSGGTLKQTGIVTWDWSNWSSWSSGAANTAADSAFDQDLYWIQITTSTTGNGGLAQAQGSLIDRGGVSFLPEANGMTEYVAQTGERTVAISSEIPGRYNDTLMALPVEPRAYLADLGRGDLVPLRIPQEFKVEGRPGIKTSLQVFNGWLIGTTSGGYLWRYKNGATAALETYPGMDAQNNVVGAQSYFLKTPRGTMLETYRNRLVIAGDPKAPMTFYLSIEDNNVSVIPASAPVGGPNVWPLRYSFTIPGKDGDRIVAISMINDRLVLFTRSQTWVYDDTSLRLINGDVGCVATGSVQKVENQVYFVSDLGVFTTDGANVVNVSGSIWNTLNSMMNWQSMNGCTSAHDRTRGEYRVYVPINGEPQNQLCVVYDYINGAWSFAGGWYPFDTNARRDANSVVMSVAASCQAEAADGRQVCLTCDTNGVLWQENKGVDDNGTIFPAYLVLPAVGFSGYANVWGLGAASAQSGEDFASFRDWYMNVAMDGSWLECMSLAEGERFDQELDRRFANVATNSEVVQKQAVIGNSVQANTVSPIYANSPAWATTPNFAQPKKLKFSFGRSLTRMQPVIHWSPGQYVSGTYTTTPVGGRGSIYDLQVDVTKRRGAR